MTETLRLDIPGVLETRLRRCARTQPGSGHSRARAINPRSLRTWKIPWKSMSKAEADELERVRHSSSVSPFDWTPPGAVAPVSVRVMNDTQHRTFLSTKSASLDVTLEEVR